MNIKEKVSVIREEIMKEASQKKEEMIRLEKEKWVKQYQKFRREIEREKEEILHSYKQEAEPKKEEMVSKAILEYKKSRRKKRQEFLNQMVEELYGKLDKYRDDESYPHFLKKLIREAVKTLGSKRVYLFFNKADLVIYRSKIEKELASEFPEYDFLLREEEIKDIKGGVIVEREDGKELVENSFTTCLEKIKDELAFALQNKLA